MSNEPIAANVKVNATASTSPEPIRQYNASIEMVEEAIVYLAGAAEKWYTDEVEREKIRPDATWAQ